MLTGTEINLGSPQSTAKPARPQGRKPRVLIYTSLFPNSVRPVHGNFILERMRHLTSYLDMTVVAPVPYFPRRNINQYWFKFANIPHSEQFAGFEVDHPRYVVIPKVGMVTHGLSMYAGSVAQVAKRLNHADYDLIDAHYVYPDGFAASLLGARFNKPVVISARGSDVNQFVQFTTIRPMIRRVLKKAAKVIAVSESLKNVMVEAGCPAEKISVIPNGVDAGKFAPQPRAAARKKLGLDGERRMILAVGNLNDNKGFSILIDAVARLRTACPDVLLVIIGDGALKGALREQIERLKLGNHVLMAGPVAHAELSPWYSAADVFCLASLREGCPNVVLEAMACGCPVVATRAGGVPDLIHSPSLGLLVERTAEAFEAGIAQALNRSWNREEIVRHGNGHSWEAVSARLLTLYSEVLTGVPR